MAPIKAFSIEEKAKAYDKAIERAKSKIKNDKDHVLYEDDVIEIFPELKESEDKKPNGAIVMEDFNEGNGFYKVNLAYLNKEQVEDIENIIKRWNVQKYDEEAIRDCIGVILTDAPKQRFLDFNTSLKDCLAWLEKQGEPVDINPSEFDSRLNKLLKQFGTLPKVELLDSLWFYYNVVRNGDIYMPCEQKPVEWSEEDDTMTTNTIIMLKEGASLHFNKKDITKAVDWLKSLKDRYAWKPSELQLECLDDAIKHYQSKGSRPVILMELLEKLKKL